MDSPDPLAPGRNRGKGGVRIRYLAIPILFTLQNPVKNIKVKVVLRFTKTDKLILQLTIDNAQAGNPASQLRPHDYSQTSLETNICSAKVLLLQIRTTTPTGERAQEGQSQELPFSHGDKECPEGRCYGGTCRVMSEEGCSHQAR